MNQAKKGDIASKPSKLQSRLITAAKDLSHAMGQLEFEEPVTHIYNPLDYAWPLHEQFIRMVGDDADVLLLGMNPGPWGMAQTGVPFGEIAAVRDWMQLDATVDSIEDEHPKRPIEGLDCQRSEVSGRRLWGLIQEKYPTPVDFFKRHFVANYCPLVFMEATGRNRTPDKLASHERDAIEVACDQHLAAILNATTWKHLIGVGAFAQKCLERVAKTVRCESSISRILHPSPASPAANRDWAGTATKQLHEAGVW